MKYVATVTKVLQRGIHKIAGLRNGELSAEDLPRPGRVEIRPEGPDGPFFLVRYTAAGEFCGDTWHETWDEALGQAKFEYGLTENDFVAVENSA
jgi:hypothetical protein